MSTQNLAEDTSINDLDLQLKQIVIAVLNLDMTSDAIDDETNLYELGLESLNVVELLTEAEINFDLTVDVEDLSEELFARFGNLKDFVQQKINEAN